ncbi:MAG: flagellar protein export ATPase FliI [Candidatus Pacebacteria bacterium]|nr:flagellar protein export ATPase FliI [Candidatus Paceibacterota bacterium]
MHSDLFLSSIADLPTKQVYGKVTGVLGMIAEIGGIENVLSIGDRISITARNDREVLADVIGFRGAQALVMPLASLDGVGLGCRVALVETNPVIYPDPSWLGRVIDGLGRPIDGKGPLVKGNQAYGIRSSPPPAHQRQRVGGKLDLGVRALNQFLTCCQGQRMGIFAGSGIGKSTLLSMIARYTSADVSVIGLIGERGREVQEFIHDDLGAEGLARSVLVVSTSDESPLLRRQAAHLTLAVAEYFRDRDQRVLCLMDSVTRFAMAQREIGLSAGEPPASKGYTPTVFAELPKLLERAGPGVGAGSITGLFTVLVEGDDHNEPISDAVRGILDGHIVLERSVAERGRYPAINVLRSISRTLPGCNSDAENLVLMRARQLLAAYEDMAEMIRLGAYRPGSDPRTDEAIKFYPALEAFLGQRKNEPAPLDAGYQQLAEVLEMGWPPIMPAAAEAQS